MHDLVCLHDASLRRHLKPTDVSWQLKRQSILSEKLTSRLVRVSRDQAHLIIPHWRKFILILAILTFPNSKTELVKIYL